MKKIISLLLATLVCAALFVGCGSGSGKTEAYPDSKYNMLHNGSIPLDVSGDFLKNRGYEFTSDSGDNAYNKSLNNVKVGNIVLSGKADFLLDSTNTVFCIYYKYTNSTSSTIIQLTKIYGSYTKDGSTYTWKITLPDDSEWIIELYDWSDSSTLSDYKEIKFYDKKKYDKWMDDYYKEEAKKLTTKQKDIIKQSIEIADSYLDFKLDGKKAISQLDTLDERYKGLSETTDYDIIGSQISSLSTRISLNEMSKDYDKNVIETRNTLAIAVGISER